MKQPTSDSYKRQLLEAKLNGASAKCPKHRCDVNNFIRSMVDMGAASASCGGIVLANFSVFPTYDSPQDLIKAGVLRNLGGGF